MKTPRLTPSRIYVACGIAGVAITAAGWFFLLGGALARHDLMLTEQRETADHRHKAAMVKAELSANRRELARLQKDLHQGALTLQPASCVNERLAKITSLAVENGLTLDQVRADTIAEGVTSQTVPIHLTGAGPYANCATFIHRLHETFPDIGVSALDAATATPGAAKTSAASLRLDMVWYTSGNSQ